MDSVVSADSPIIASTEAPANNIYYGRWLNLNNSRLYNWEGDEWMKQGDGMSLAHDGDKMEITKLTIVDGIITELEYGT